MGQNPDIKVFRLDIRVAQGEGGEFPEGVGPIDIQFKVCPTSV